MPGLRRLLAGNGCEWGWGMDRTKSNPAISKDSWRRWHEMRKAVYESRGGGGGHAPGRGTKGPVPLSLAAQEPLGAQPRLSRGSRGCELPALPPSCQHPRETDKR